jgi:hypothetical protein
MPPARFQLLVAAAVAVVIAQSSAAAEDFYAGKTVTIYSGHQPGSLYDTNARFVARHLPRFIPGNPTMIVRNMPGAGTLTASNHVANLAPKDGTALALIARGVAIEPLIGGQGIRFEPRALHWIGSSSQEVSVIAVRADTGVKTLDDARAREVVLAASGGDGVTFPNAMNKLFGTRFRTLSGYRSSAEMALSIERKETDGRGSWSWSAFRNDGMAMFKRGELILLVQMGFVAIPEISKVPLVMDLAKDARQRQILEVLLAAQAMAWPMFAPAEVPAERVAILRQAYIAMFNDSEALADAGKTGIEVAPVSGTAINDMLGRVFATPPAVIEQARELVGRK